ncbi:hypothetical protein QCA50_005272 [Cerrena zonata]|uniref:Pheromone receptor n=1 Tax=Cerrena zonata TaxID=2478898 RepID=A0AAW0GEE0_9APHY
MVRDLLVQPIQNVYIPLKVIDLHLDIRFQYASSVGILSAALVIARRVSLISTSSPAVLLSHNKMRGMCIDLAIGLSPPIAQIIEYWFLAGHRFDILEGLGCYPAIPFSILDICLRWIWLFIIGLTSAYYCVRTLLALRRRQKEIKEVLFAANIDKQLYYRLVAMACVEISCTLPLVTYLVVGARTEYYPWKGFADLHYKFSRIDQYPYALWAAFPGAAQVTQWFQIGCGLVYFLLLGLTRDARSRYAKMLGLSKLFQSLTGDIMPTSTGKKSRRSTNFPWRKRHTAQRPTPHHVSTDLHFNSCPTSITESGLATSDIDHTMESV